MSLLFKSAHLEVEGFESLTIQTEPVEVTAPPVMRIPLINGAPVCNPAVKEGDEVKVGTVLNVVDDTCIPVFSSVSGVVKGIDKGMGAGLKPVNHVVIENDGQFTAEEPWEKPGADATREELIAFTRRSGVVNTDGSPLFTKFKDTAKVLVINGVGGEPYVTSDLVALQKHKEEFEIGLRALKTMSDVFDVKIATTKERKKYFEDLGYLVIVKQPSNCDTLLLTSLEMKEDETVIIDSTAVFELGLCIKTGRPNTKKLVTVSGNGIQKCRNMICPVGTPVNVMIKMNEGYIAREVEAITEGLGYEANEEAVVIAGGPLMGKSINSDTWSTTNYLNAVTVMKPEVRKLAHCMRCGRCSDVCPLGLQPMRIHEANRAQNVDLMLKMGVDQCVECGYCSYVCPSKIECTDNVRKAKRYLALKAKKK